MGDSFMKDKNRLGKRLLEKMGWCEGKGLGVNEDGRTDALKVTLKNDNAGVGYTSSKYEDVWLGHQDAFNDVLTSLAQVANTSPQAARKPSQSRSRNSSHVGFSYRSMQSKDLSTKSVKDLECIFGCKKQHPDEKIKEEKMASKRKSKVDLKGPIEDRDNTANKKIHKNSENSSSESDNAEHSDNKKGEESVLSRGVADHEIAQFKDWSTVFPGSNLAQVKGYVGYQVSDSVEEEMKLKLNRKLKKMQKRDLDKRRE